MKSDERNASLELEKNCLLKCIVSKLSRGFLSSQVSASADWTGYSKTNLVYICENELLFLTHFD